MESSLYFFLEPFNVTTYMIGEFFNDLVKLRIADGIIGGSFRGFISVSIIKVHGTSTKRRKSEESRVWI